MANALAHRGPDAEGFWRLGPGQEGLCDADALGEPLQVALAHRRLSIVDLARGQQPMANEDGTVWVTYNGEIYNQKSLRRQLERRGHVFSTSCDTEVIVHGWEEWRADVLGRLNGIFAIALIDRRTDEIILARDPVGVKPLFVGVAGKSAWWSSELAAAVKAGVVPNEISPEALKLFFMFRFIPSPFTIYRSAWKVPPGHFVRFNWRRGLDAPPRFESFPSAVRSSADPRGREEWREALVDELGHAVDRQLMADVRVGSLLSGGVDSSLVTAMMAQRLPYRPMTFGIGFRSSAGRSEAVAARIAAAELGVPHRSLELSDDEYLAGWPASFRQLAEPLANGGGLLVHLLCRLASEDHKVVLTGQGADEPLGGYSRHAVERLYVVGRLAPRLFPTLARPALGADTSERLGRALAQADRVDRYIEILSGVSASEVDRLVTAPAAPAREVARKAVEPWVSADPDVDPVNDLLRIDSRMSLADDVLLIADHHSMRASVELRVPFLDLQFLELVERMPSVYKISWLGERKWLYREAASRQLPPSLRRRVCGPVARLGRKRGFAAPMASWLDGSDAHGRLDRRWLGWLTEVPEISSTAVQALAARPERNNQMRRNASLYALAHWIAAYHRPAYSSAA
jgi:asparagine synthase (glutamine-hydrolysing)